MTSDEAKQTLTLYRPATTDRNDPEIAEALVLAQRDPELANWLEQHCALHAAIRTKFKQIVVPEGLKEQILSERKSYLSRRVKRRKLVFATVALSLLLLVSVVFVRFGSRTDQEGEQAYHTNGHNGDGQTP